jgi:hypothetical protein
MTGESKSYNQLRETSLNKPVPSAKVAHDLFQALLDYDTACINPGATESNQRFELDAVRRRTSDALARLATSTQKELYKLYDMSAPEGDNPDDSKFQLVRGITRGLAVLPQNDILGRPGLEILELVCGEDPDHPNDKYRYTREGIAMIKARGEEGYASDLDTATLIRATIANGEGDDKPSYDWTEYYTPNTP